MKEVVRILKALGNERRLKITKLLKENHQMNVGDLGGFLMLSFRSTSKHLHRLKDAGLVESKQIGSAMYYYLSKDIEPTYKTIIDKV